MNLLDVNDKAGEYPPSYYAATADLLPPFPALSGAVSCDVCVVGGGYTGLSAALHLARRGYDVVLIDAQRVGWGASGRNGGQVGSGQRVAQDSLQGLLGKPHARALWDLAEAAKARVKSLIGEHGIGCDWKPGILHADLKARFVPHSLAYADMLNRDYGYSDIRGVDRAEICEMLGTTAYFGGTLDMGSGHLHALNYALGLARAAVKASVRIFERTRMLSYTDGATVRVTTDHGQINAKFLILGCNGYLGAIEPKVAARVMPMNNFILTTEPLGEDRAKSLIRDDVAVADSKFVINYFRRTADHRLLFGGGETYSYRFPANLARLPQRAMLEIYPQLADVKIDHSWGGTLAITMNRLPNFQRLAGNVFNASGYSGHGIAMATLAGEILAETVAGTSERFDIFERIPTPKFPGGPALRSPLLVLAMIWFRLRDAF